MDYSFNSRVRYSETGEDGRLTLPGVLNYFQDCSTFHAESIGLGGNVLKNRDRRRAEGKRQSVGSFFLAGGC